MEYVIHLANIICIYLILAHSYNLVFGLGLLFNLAHVAFYAVGAYTTALLAVDYNCNLALCFVLSGVFAALTAPAVAVISHKLVNDYFAIGTLAFQAIIVSILINFKSFTHGVLGIPGIPRPNIFGFDLQISHNFLTVAAILVAFTLFVHWILIRGRIGRALRAQAEFEPAAQALGIDSGNLRMQALLISAVFAGFGGSVFAFLINYIDPSSFSLSEMVLVLTIVIVGRPGSFWGVTASTFFLILLPEALRFFELPSSILGPMRQMLWAAILFGVVYWKRSQLFPVRRQV